jgi:hypothetical protein
VVPWDSPSVSNLVQCRFEPIVYPTPYAPILSTHPRLPQCNADSNLSCTLNPIPLLLHSSQASILILEAGSCSSSPSPIPSLPPPSSGPFLWEGSDSRAKVCGGATALKGGAVARSVAPVSGMWGDSVWKHHMAKAAKMVNPALLLKGPFSCLFILSRFFTNLFYTCT